MRLGVDLLFLIPGETGGRETYARELIAALVRASPELELTAFVNREAGHQYASELPVGVAVVTVPVSARNRLQWAIGELALLPAYARRARIELLHSPANFAPVGGPFRRVVTVHDLQYRALPQLVSLSSRVGTAHMVKLGARRADRVLTGSKSAAQELVSQLGLRRERIDVVPHGGSAGRGVVPVSAAELRARHDLGDRKVALCPAAYLPHKNLPALIDALAAIPAPERPVLVLVGHGTDDPALRERARAAGVPDDVRGLGSCAAAELEGFYGLASCLAFPTRHEGFGLPVLEAMTRGVPVACSDLPVLHEVAGNAALYFDAADPSDIAGTLRRLLGDGRLADRLRELGRERAERFTWSAAAAGTLDCYRKALQAR